MKYANNANVAQQLRDRFPHPYTVADARQFIQSRRRRAPTTSFAIVVDGEAGRRHRVLRRAPTSSASRPRSATGSPSRSGAAASRPTRSGSCRATPSTPATCCACSRCRSPTTRSRSACSRRPATRAKRSCASSSVKYGVVRDQALYALVNERVEGRLGVGGLGFGRLWRCSDPGPGAPNSNGRQSHPAIHEEIPPDPEWHGPRYLTGLQSLRTDMDHLNRTSLTPSAACSRLRLSPPSPSPRSRWASAPTAPSSASSTACC